MKKHSAIIIKGSIVMLMGILIKTGLGLVRNLVVGRTLGAEILGTFSIANTIFQIASIIAIFGLYNTINRFIPEYNQKGKQRSQYNVIGTSLKFSIVLSIILTIVIFLFASRISSLLKDENLAATLQILIVGLPFFTIVRILISIATSYETTKLQALIENILLPLITFGTLLLLIQFDLGFATIPYSFLCGYIVTFVLTLISTRFGRLSRINFIQAISYFNPKFIFYSIPIVTHRLLFFFMRWIETLTIGYFKTSKDVGVYTATFAIATMPTFFATALNTIFLPTTSRLISQGNFIEAINTYRSSIRVLSYIVIPLILFNSIFAEDIMSLFGKDFQITRNLMIFLSIGAFFNVFAGPIDSLLNALDKQKLISINSAIALAISVLLNVMLIPRYGLLGAAVANSVAVIVQNYLGLIELYIMKKIIPYTTKSILLVLVSIVIFIAVSLLKDQLLLFDIGANSFMIKLIKLGIFAVCMYIVFFMIVIALKLYASNDKILIQQLFKRIVNGKLKKEKKHNTYCL